MSSTQLSLSSSGSPSKYQIELVYTVSVHLLNYYILHGFLHTMWYLQPAVPIPSSYALSLEALDGLGDLDRVEASATEKQPNLLLNVTGLESWRLWNCIVVAFGCEEHSLAYTLLSGYICRTIVKAVIFPLILH